MKTCQVCNQAKPLDQFWRNRSAYDGLQATCKECSKKAQRAYYRNTIKVKREILKRYPPQTNIEVEDPFNQFLEDQNF